MLKTKKVAKTATKSEVSPPAGAKDTIAKNRMLLFATADQFPPVPDGYQPTRPEDRRRRLRPLPSGMVAEGLRALEELGNRRAALKADFGEHAPDVEGAAALAARIQSLEEAIGTQEALLQAYRELEDIALTDAVELLEAVYDEYAHRVRKVPSLATRYPMLEAFFKARSSAISKGIARAARDQRGSEEEPAEEQG